MDKNRKQKISKIKKQLLSWSISGQWLIAQLQFQELFLIKRNMIESSEPKYYCRLFKNGAIDNKCNGQCKDCKIASADDLLHQNFVLSNTALSIRDINEKK